MFKYSLPNLIKAYTENRELISAYQGGKSMEGFALSVDGATTDDSKIIGMTVGLFIAVFVISLVLWVWGLIVMIVYWKFLADWAKALGIIGLFIGLPLMTIVVGYLGKK